MLAHTRRGATIVRGTVQIDGVDILARSARELRQLRGRVVSYIPQDPSVALNPALRLRTQLLEALEAHAFGGSGSARRERVRELLDSVLLPHDDEFLARYPHQLSGGQQQRIAIGMAFACRPRFIILDEPTTGLDVTTQAHILETLRDLCRSHGVAALYVTHDLAVVATLADRVAVMYGGRIVEEGPQRELFRNPAHPYTRKLIQAVPDISGRYALAGVPGRAPSPGTRPDGCFFGPRCEFYREEHSESFPPVTEVSPKHTVRCFRAADVLAATTRERIHAQRAERVEHARGGRLLSIRELQAWYGRRKVIHGIDLELRPGECLAIVGQSGSGKTTLARCIAGIHSQCQGLIRLGDLRLSPSAQSRTRETRRTIQYIFQNPYSSLNPRKTVGQTIAQPLLLFFDMTPRIAEREARKLLEVVALSPAMAARYPDQLSGGERQRVAIARALAAKPNLLICDEITAALDVSVQAAIVELLEELQREMRLGLVFVTHNLALIRTIADDVAVMRAGRVVEFGPVDDVLRASSEAYTRELVTNTPSIDAALRATA
jgi:peptide/nickel transport system ATP-binding protein